MKVGPVDAQSSSTSNSNEGTKAQDQTHPLLNALTSAPILSCTSVSAPTLRNLQLEKLTINAILNPLTAILGIKNGEILHHAPVVRITRLLVEECSRILISLPELQSSYSDSTEGHEMSTEERFAPDRLEGLVRTVAQKTAANTSSMLQDVQGGRETEIEYINGYFVRRAKEAGVECSTNERIVELVKAGVRVGVEELEGLFEGLDRSVRKR